jgi:hypothetical protein
MGKAAQSDCKEDCQHAAPLRNNLHNAALLMSSLRSTSVHNPVRTVDQQHFSVLPCSALPLAADRYLLNRAPRKLLQVCCKSRPINASGSWKTLVQTLEHGNFRECNVKRMHMPTKKMHLLVKIISQRSRTPNIEGASLWPAVQVAFQFPSAVPSG